MMKGMSPGTALVLLMAGPAANIASMMVIGKVLGKKTFVLYLTTLVVGAIAFGLIIDNFLPAGWFDIANFTTATNHCGHFYYLKVVCSCILLVLFTNAIVFKKPEGKAEEEKNADTCGTISFRIAGMHCNNCKRNATQAISHLKSVQEVTIDLKNDIARVKGNPTDEEIKSAVEPLGFEFKGRI